METGRGRLGTVWTGGHRGVAPHAYHPAAGRCLNPMKLFKQAEDRAIEHLAAHPATVLQVDGLCFNYPQRELFSDWSAHISPGVTLVQGDEGSGKTTLLRLLAGELSAQSGALKLNGISLKEQPQTYHQQ